MATAQTKQNGETLLKNSPAFSGFSVRDVPSAKAFYGGTLGLEVLEDKAMNILTLKLKGGNNVFLSEAESFTGHIHSSQFSGR
jgi:catechol-2,3-dioxygenase